jgi:hypothetical protein
MKAAAPCLLSLLLFAGCRNPVAEASARNPYGAAPRPAGPAPVVFGTVIEASTGKPLPGARVRAPNGVEVVCDARGRFVLAGLEPGLSGELVGTSESGLEGRNRLRPLEPGRLEVVLYLRPR